jgi:hypothetical protein
MATFRFFLSGQRVSRNLEALHFRGALSNSESSCVTIKPLDRKFAHVAHAAEYLQGPVRDPATHFTRVQLCSRGSNARLRNIGLHEFSRTSDQESRRFDLDIVIRDHELDRLMIRELRAKC